jgi:hypothetical protein
VYARAGAAGLSLADAGLAPQGVLFVQVDDDGSGGGSGVDGGGGGGGASGSGGT